MLNGVKREWRTDDGSVWLMQGDCLEILPQLEGEYDGIATDPPYGINFRCNASTRKWDAIENDDGELDIRKILSSDVPVVSFGASYYPDQLPHGGRWLCWDKRTADGKADAMLGSPFELAWSNQKSGFYKIVRVLHGGVVNADGGLRVHPTQKPVATMVASIEWACRSATCILDPFMGSGTTGIACLRLGRKFIGIEIDDKHYETAVARITEELNRYRAFESVPKVVQRSMFDATPSRESDQ